MTCNHPKDKLCSLTADVLWCSVCGSTRENGEWKLSQQEQSLRTAGWVWENPTERIEEPHLIGAIKVLPDSKLSGIELAYALRGVRILLHINRRFQYVNELLENVLQEQNRTGWGYTLGRPIMLLPGMLAEIKFEPGEFGWECRWLAKKMQGGEALDRLMRMSPGSEEWQMLSREQLVALGAFR